MPMGKNKNLHVGIGIDLNHIAVVEIIQNKNRITLQQTWHKKFSSAVFNYADLKSHFQNIAQCFSTHSKILNISISHKLWNVQTFELNQTLSKAETQKYLKQQVDLKNIYYIYHFINLNDHVVHLILVSITREILDPLLHLLITVNLRPRKIEPDVFSLARIIPTPNDWNLIIDTRHEQFILVLTQQHQLFSLKHISQDYTQLSSQVLLYKNQVKSLSRVFFYPQNNVDSRFEIETGMKAEILTHHQIEAEFLTAYCAALEG